MSVYIPADPDMLEHSAVDFIYFDLYGASHPLQSMRYVAGSGGLRETAAYVEVTPEADCGHWEKASGGFVQQNFNGRCTIRFVFWEQGERNEWVLGPGEYRRVHARLLRLDDDGVTTKYMEEIYVTDRTVR